jgi:hypothetical protein
LLKPLEGAEAGSKDPLSIGGVTRIPFAWTCGGGVEGSILIGTRLSQTRSIAWHTVCICTERSVLISKREGVTYCAFYREDTPRAEIQISLVETQTRGDLAPGSFDRLDRLARPLEQIFEIG